MTTTAPRDWRLDVIRANLENKEITIRCTGNVIDVLFFQDDDMPVRNPTAALERCAKVYWRLLQHGANLFTRDEWELLGKLRDFSIGRDWLSLESQYTPVQITYLFDEMYGDGKWNDKVMVLKGLIPKILRLTPTEFEAVREILAIADNLFSDDPFFSLSVKLEGLR